MLLIAQVLFSMIWAEGLGEVVGQLIIRADRFHRMRLSMELSLGSNLCVSRPFAVSLLAGALFRNGCRKMRGGLWKWSWSFGDSLFC